MRSKEIIYDIILNILASIMPIGVLQLLIFPFIASRVSAEKYGLILTIVSFINLFAGTFGSVLNNSRLISYKKYEKMNIDGDFNILFILFLFVNIFVMTLGLRYYKLLDIVTIVLIILTAIFLTAWGYGQVEFRIKLNYKNILINSICLIIGYGIGVIFFLYTKHWEFIYLFGFAFSCLFVFNKTHIFMESLKRTVLFKATTYQTLSLLISGLLLSATMYFDRLLLYPLLGGLAVSIYYVATILGKTISLAIQPIAGVFLSYLAQMTKFDNRKLYKLFAISIIFTGIGYFVIILVSKPVLTLMYPQYVNQALKYIYITTLTTVIGVTSNLLNPLVLKFCKPKWQIVINTVYLAIYIFLSMFLVKIYGLMGFCIGILIATVIQLFVMSIVYYFTNIKSIRLDCQNSQQ